MTDCCKACGRDVSFTPRTDALLGWVNLSSWPDWLDGICASCILSLRNYAEPEGEDLEPVTPAHLNEFLGEMLRDLAGRVGTGKPLFHCEAFDDSHWNNLPPLQCGKFATTVINGRNVCCLHRDRALKRGQDLAFVGADAKAARPFLIWAKSGAQLIERASGIAAAFDAEGA